MAKLDVTQIPNYDSLSEETKQYLSSYEYNDGATEIERYKNAVSKANGEVAEWKKKYNEKLTDDERNKLEHDDMVKQLQDQVKSLTRDKHIADLKSGLVGQGWNDADALAGATALADGDTDAYLVKQSAFLSAQKEIIKQELLKSTPKPPAPQPGDGAMTLEKLRKLPLAERLAFAQEHPDEYEKLYGGS